MRIEDLDARWHERQQRQARRCNAMLAQPETTPPLEPTPATPIPEPQQRLTQANAPAAPEQPQPRRRPAANHPWRQPVVLKTKRQLAQAKPSLKL